MSPSQPDVSHLIFSFTPSLCISLSIPTNNRSLRKPQTAVLHPDRHSRCTTLQLLRQPVFRQHRRLGFLDSTRGIEYVGKNKSLSVTVEVWNKESATDPLIIILTNMLSWVVSFTLRPS